MSAYRLRNILLTGTAIAASVGSAQAQTLPGPAGTGAGTVISNVAQATYSVNGTPQTATSNTANFVVDRKVNLTVVATQTINTQVNLGQTNAVLTYQVTNNTNATQDFILSTAQTISLGILTGTDNFDATNLRTFVDSNANGTYEAGVDIATFIDELPADGIATVFIVADIPASNDASLAFVQLRATVAAAGAQGTVGAALIPTPTNIINQDNEIDVVFVDNDSDGLSIGGDLARNGQGVAYAAYEVGTRNVALAVTKSMRVIADGFDLVNPKAIPGATVEYCLVATNGTLSTPASNVVLTDIVPPGTTYVPNTLQIGVGGGVSACLLSGNPIADDGSTLTGPYRGSYAAGTRTITANLGSVGSLNPVAASFRVIIN